MRDANGLRAFRSLIFLLHGGLGDTAIELLKIINGAKKTAGILPVRQVAVTLHKI